MISYDIPRIPYVLPGIYVVPTSVSMDPWDLLDASGIQRTNIQKETMQMWKAQKKCNRAKNQKIIGNS